ncbi:tRNA pseudouridine synthase A [Aquimarina agarivorans]|uniref:tRNA pseudouridine synthase A n=1 Tax=Aquimarina agarivorans TaxID=980584 RepID=UPI000497664B|nr:pseudouridine synthase [Aquimarina agarivorans]
MMRKRYFYLIEIQYLGFRYHGWQKQPEVNTIQRMLERTLKYVLDNGVKFKTLSVGRTDAMVSARQSYVELFVDDFELDLEAFFPLLNLNLPPDIRALGIKETTKDFNIIQHPKVKEYQYLFAVGKKFHPFCAPFMVNIQQELNIPLMQQAAKLFEGTHDFWSYAHRSNENTITKGNITHCCLTKNEVYKANFFPENTYILIVKGAGFKRNQIRLMMGVLFDLGKGKIDIDFVKRTLNPKIHRIKLEHIAQASGLFLNKVTFE